MTDDSKAIQVYIKFLNGELMLLERPCDEKVEDLTAYVESELPDCPPGGLLLTLLSSSPEEIMYGALIDESTLTIQLARRSDVWINTDLSFMHFHITFLRNGRHPFRGYSFFYDPAHGLFSSMNEYIAEDCNGYYPRPGGVAEYSTLHECIEGFHPEYSTHPYEQPRFTLSLIRTAEQQWEEELRSMWREDDGINEIAPQYIINHHFAI